MYRVWHLGKKNPNDILVRLFHDTFPGPLGKGGYVDLCEVNEKGEKRKELISFSIMHGMLLVGIYGDKFTQYTDESLYRESRVPFYKIWHEPHKARNRLRLKQTSSGVTVISVDCEGRIFCAQNILAINSDRITPCYGCMSDIPKDKNGGILRI